MVTAIITAAGHGRRMGQSGNKLFLPLGGRPVLVHTVLAFAASKTVADLIVTAAAGQEKDIYNLLDALMLDKPWQVVTGGKERQHSIANALDAVSATADIILVHDGARPLIVPELIDKVAEAATQHQAALLAVKVKDTVKESAPDGFVAQTLVREKLWAVQTPQAFKADILRKAYCQAAEEGYLGTDDASLVERLGVKVKIIPGDYRNIKVTTPDDIILLESFCKNLSVDFSQKNLSADCLQKKSPADCLSKKPPADLLQEKPPADCLHQNLPADFPQKNPPCPHVGIGYDVHQLVTGRKLILGGVEIAHTHGLQGHSDADVLLHAVKDALLGAAALGDIGRHFPDTNAEYKGISSLKLLEMVRDILHTAQFQINNIDATIVAQKPKLAPYIPEMTRNIAVALKINISNVNVKATTTEGLGFAGRQEGIAAYATASIVLNSG